jgi:hypothetical protein
MSIVDGARPTIIEVDSWSKLTRVYEFLAKKDWKTLAEKLSTDVLEYKSVMIDSGTELEYVLRQEVVREGGSLSEVPEQQHYLKTQERFRRMYRKFRDLPGISLVVTAGVRELKDDVGGIIKLYPDFQPALCHDLLRMTDEIFFMGVKQEDKQWIHVLQTHLTNKIVARDRSSRLDAVIKGEKLYFKDIVEKVLL